MQTAGGLRRGHLHFRRVQPGARARDDRHRAKDIDLFGRLGGGTANFSRSSPADFQPPHALSRRSTRVSW